MARTVWTSCVGFAGFLMAIPVPMSPAAWVALGILLAAVGAREATRPRFRCSQ